tara:strand:- start:527 stop:775 length:249 start_codon:yes stop_codon:yes gene_type:complete
MNEEILQEKIRNTVEYYIIMREQNPYSSMLREVKGQYADMAEGGDGGTAGSGLPGEGTIRSEHYPGYPDRFFQAVRNLMGWD